MCSAIFRLVFAALCIVGAEAALAQTTSWTDGTGDWFNANNWSAGVPDSSHAAYINNGGTAQLAANGGTISGILLGMNAADSGALSISGAGNLTTDNSVEVGQSGTGLLEITSGGDLSVSRFLIGTNTGSHGTITVSGIGSTLSGSAAVSFIGFNGTATLNVLSGAVASTLNSVSVGENGSSNGTVTIDGAGSKWTVGGFLTISGNGTASLSITNGGYVSTGGAEIARNPGGNATVTVLGGSTWANFGPLVVSDGFAVSSGSLQIASGSSVSDTYSIVGGAGGHGTVTVEGMGTAWTHSSDLTVGSDQGNGTLSITNGATVSNSRGYIGFNGFGSGQSVGMVTVDGTGSKWTNSANLYIGGSESGAGGSGVLRIQNGGTVSAAATTVWSKGTLEIGSTASLSGPLTFSGGKLRFVADASFANDATLGTGGLTVDSNGFSSSLSGKLSGSAALTKTGNGTTALSGANTYTGGTTVNSGMLLVNNSTGSGTGTSTVQVSAGKLGGTGTIAGAVTVGRRGRFHFSRDECGCPNDSKLANSEFGCNFHIRIKQQHWARGQNCRKRSDDQRSAIFLHRPA